MITVDRARRAAAILFVVTAALFAVGVAAEDDTHSEPAAESSSTPAEQPAGESGEAHEEGAEETGDEAEEGSGREGDDAGHDESAEDETVLGIDAESPATVTLAVLVSIALAAGLWFTKRRAVAIAAAVAAILFAVFDIAEVAHQLDESNNALAALALTVAVGHLLAGAGAGWFAWGSGSGD
jgi:hypothetical protein